MGLPLVAVPFLIHLLNLRKQRRVEWAAMEFLLESDQRNRRWVNLREWLLLAARVLAVMLAVIMLAGPRIAGTLAGWFSADGVHHVIVLDDSYSMTDQGPRSIAWENAREVVEHVIAEATKSPQHRVSIWRSSQLMADDEGQATAVTAYGRTELATLGEQVQAWQASEAAAPLGPTLQAAAQAAEISSEQGPIVAYVVSDFRSREVEPENQFASPLAELATVSNAVHMTPVVENRRANLAVSELRLLPGVKVAGLELTAEVEVTNFGSRPVERVMVEIKRDGQPISAVEFDTIPPREARVTKFAVRFDGAGDHLLQANIEADAVAADNQRRLAISLPDRRRVLIVDGSPGGHEGLAYASALQPRGVVTGWEPVRMGIGGLESLGDLNEYAAVLLLDPTRLTPSAAARLAAYVEQRGGVLVSLGPSADRRNLNSRLLADSPAPLLPFRLDAPTQLASASDPTATDIVSTDHPLLRVFQGDRNSFLQLIAVDYFHALAPEESSGLPGWSTIAALRSGAPLLVESVSPDRRVVGLLTSATRPRDAVEGWSNLGVSPLFPVLVNELAAYLASPALEVPRLHVAEAWDAEDFSSMDVSNLLAARVDRAFSAEPAIASPRVPARQGWYRITSSDDASEAGELLAVNVDANEGDLAGPSVEELSERFGGQGVRVTSLAEMLRSDNDSSEASLAHALAWGLLVLLVFEKLLAVRCSYHQAPAAGRVA